MQTNPLSYGWLPTSCSPIKFPTKICVASSAALLHNIPQFPHFSLWWGFPSPFSFFLSFSLSACSLLLLHIIFVCCTAKINNDDIFQNLQHANAVLAKTTFSPPTFTPTTGGQSAESWICAVHWQWHIRSPRSLPSSTIQYWKSPVITRFSPQKIHSRDRRAFFARFYRYDLDDLPTLGSPKIT